MEIKIYSLIDPRTNEIRYVGQTKRGLVERLSDHMLCKPIQNNHKYNWINSLKKEGVKPLIIELETCDETNWVERERYWINQYDNLTNLTTGGEGCNHFTQEVLDKKSNSMKKVWLKPGYKDMISEKRKEYWSNLENRKSYSAKMKGKSCSKAFCESLSQRSIEMWKNTEYREKMTKGGIDRWKNKEFREKILSFIRSDEHRKTVSDRFKDKKFSEERKKKMSEDSRRNQQISVDGVIYESISIASKLIPMNYNKLRSRINNIHFSEYHKIKKED